VAWRAHLPSSRNNWCARRRARRWHHLVRGGGVRGICGGSASGGGYGGGVAQKPGQNRANGVWHLSKWTNGWQSAAKWHNAAPLHRGSRVIWRV